MRYSSDPKTNQRLLLISVGLSAIILVVVLLVYFKPTPQVTGHLPSKVSTTTPVSNQIPADIFRRYSVQTTTSGSSTASKIPPAVLKKYSAPANAKPTPISPDVLRLYAAPQ